MRRVTLRGKTCLAVVLAALLALWGSSAAAEEPSRTDHGALIVLDVHGSYREMGRQAVELLGEDGRRVYDLNLQLYRRTLTGGLRSWLFDRVGLPIAARFMSDDTGASEEAAGYAEALGVSRADILRSQIGAGAAAGSTVFAATRSAISSTSAVIHSSGPPIRRI